MIPHISKDTFVTEKICLNILTDKSQQVSIMYLYNFDGNIWLLFAGDKGGKHMKLRFEIINCKDSGPA